MRKKKRIILCAGMISLFSAVSIYAFSEAAVTYHTGSGKVQIRLEEYSRKDGKEVPWEENQTILPGGTLSKIPRIYNEGEDCYVRATVEFDSARKTKRPLTYEELEGITRDWVQSGNYFYYKKILPQKESVDFFQGIRIPDTWEDGEDDGNDWMAEVKVDAVQAEFFEPDFSSRDPWGMEREEFEIQEAADREPTQQEGDEEPVTFEMEQDLKGFSVEEQETFRNLETFLPGEAQTRVLEFTNQTKKERELYMRAEIIEKSAFLEEMELVIQIREKNHRRILYRGSLQAEKLQEYQSLGTVPAKTAEKVEFIIRLPKEADNRYSARQGSVKYWFTTNPPAENKSVDPVKTGDASEWWVLLGIVIPLPILAAGIYRKQKGYGKW